MKIYSLLNNLMQIHDISINGGLDKSENNKIKLVLEVIHVLTKFILNFNINMHKSYTFGCNIHIIQNATHIFMSNQRIHGNLLRVVYFIQLRV